MKNKGAVLSAVIGAVALAALSIVFVTNASPYVTVAEAKSIHGGDGLHVAGQIEPNSIVTDVGHKEIRFTIKDAAGQTLPVVYTGEPVSNLGSASKVVCVGGMKGAAFVSSQLQIKCPSKYESETASK